MAIPFLKGPSVFLAPHSLDDVDKYLVWINDPEVNQYLLFRVHFTRDHELEFLRTAHRPPENFFFAIHRAADEALIGGTGLHRVDMIHRRAVFGIMIGDKDCWGKGYGTEATRLLAEYAFHRLNLHRIELEVLTSNTRAIRAYEKAGFRREGIGRGAPFDNGVYHDVMLMAILAEDLA